ncbi:MAG TPA: endonuclease III [Bacteroidales bacterium]|nr:endonuclease III [Bacteroidales bacterium]
MKNTEKIKFLINYFQETNPDAATELYYKNPYELIVAVILSAQCTDVRVNKITPDFFKEFPTIYDLAVASIEAIFEKIKTCSYPNNKATHLLRMAKMVVTDFSGKIPDTRKSLEQLPGVGRKTANVMLSVAFGKPTMPVDTHVFRVSARLGLTTNAKTPLDTERKLVKLFPRMLLPKAHHWLILHGRYVCTAKKPACDKCGLKPVCRYYSDKLNQHPLTD